MLKTYFKAIIKVNIILISYFLLHIAISTPIRSADLCPEGYTCPNSKAVPIPGETIHYDELVRSMPTGPTGPQAGQLNVPDLSNENDYYSQREILDRSLPSNLVDKLLFNPIVFDAHLAHPGCGDLIIDGENTGRAHLDKKTSRFETESGYNNLFLVTNYLQTLLIPSKPSTLQYTATQPDIPEPATNVDCLNDQGSTFQPEQIQNPEPESNTFFGSSFNAISSFLGRIACEATRPITGQKCDIHVEVNIQEVKEIPGEYQFQKQTVGDDVTPEGFLGFYKSVAIPYPKDGNQKDENEKSNYKVLGKDRPVGQAGEVGVTFEGMSAFQSGTCGLIDSLYPSNIQTNCLANASAITTLVNPIPPQSPIGAPFDYNLPYMNTGIKITDKAWLIKYVKSIWPDALIDSKWDTVYNAAVSNGINPAFMIAIWIEESGASSPKVNGKSAFGCFTGGDTNKNMSFDESLSCFTYFTAKEHPSNFTDWVKHFCGPNQPQICGNNRNFVINFPEWYGRTVNGYVSNGGNGN